MKDLRIETGLKFQKNKLDEKDGFLLDSSHIFGARVILKAVIAWKAKRVIDIEEAKEAYRQGLKLMPS
jgi:hypothetical protein